MNCDPNSLAQAASCFRCIPAGHQGAVASYLICQWANATGPTPPDTRIFWTPDTAIATWNGGGSGNLAAFRLVDPTTVTFLNLSGTGITAIGNIQTLTNLDTLDVHNNNLNGTLDVHGMANLVDVDASGNAALQRFLASNCPVFTGHAGTLNLSSGNGMGGLLAVDISLCPSLGGGFDGSGNVGFSTFLLTGDGPTISSVTISGCNFGLADLDMVELRQCSTLILDHNPINGVLDLSAASMMFSLDAHACGLTNALFDPVGTWFSVDVSINAIVNVADIDNLICQVDASANFQTTQFGTLDCSGGTNAIPGAPGQACATDLINIWTWGVSTN